MLLRLYIENIALIKQCEIDFFEGFNCLTGETGAGKSLVIDSINMVLGQRT
ncbi:MAG: AAA family ATPase, partial [Clostridiaceae bacterium]|nr:AAA family ATPase [Clostridiaceae bacterium]